MADDPQGNELNWIRPVDDVRLLLSAKDDAVRLLRIAFAVRAAVDRDGGFQPETLAEAVVEATQAEETRPKSD